MALQLRGVWALLMLCFTCQSLLTGLMRKSGGVLPSFRHKYVHDDSAIGQHSTALFGGLDLNDVLDPENAEMDAFIQQLKSQMTNSLHASPREVTSRIKAYFSNRKLGGGGVPSTRTADSREELGAFKAYLEANKDVLDVVNAVLLFEGCQRSNTHITELLSWEDFLHAMENPSPTLTSSVIYRGIASLKSSHHRDEKNHNAYLSLLMKRVHESRVFLNEVDLCPAIYCCAQFSTTSSAVRQFVQYCSDSLAATDATFASKSLCSAVFGLRKMKASHEVRHLIAEIAKKIRSSETLYHPINVCIAINGLQNMDDGSSEVRELLSALVQKSILADEQGIDRVTDREISMALMGIKEMGGHLPGTSLREGHRSDACKELRETMKYITSLLRFSRDQTFEAKRLGFAVLGLQGLVIKTPEVKDLVAELAIKASTCTGDMTGQEVSMSIRGLVGMDSDDANVRALLRGLLPLVKQCRSWDCSDAQSALIGLQGLRYSSVEANKLVEAIAELLDRSPQVEFRTAEQASMALYGIQGMGSVTPEARRLLGTYPRLMSKLSTKHIEFSGRDVSQALYGLRSTSCNHKETLAVIHALQPFLDNTKGLISSQNIASAMCGLQNFESNNSIEVQHLIRSMVMLTNRCTGTLSGKGVSKCLNGLQRFRSKDAGVLDLCDALAAMLERSFKGFEGFDDFFQVSSSITGFTNKDPDDKQVLRLGNAFAKLLRAHSDDSSSLNRLYQQTPSAERVALAMYALQDVARGPMPSSPTLPFVSAIMEELLAFLRPMPTPGMRSLGMMIQCYKGVHVPSPPFEKALEIIADKMEGGWSTRTSKSSRQGNRKKPLGEEVDVVSSDGTRVSSEDWKERQTTLRSCLTGLAAMSKQVPARKRVLNILLEDVEDWPLDVIEKRTLETISSSFYYKGRLMAELASPETKNVLTRLGPVFEQFELGPYYRTYGRVGDDSRDSSSGSGSGSGRRESATQQQQDKKWVRKTAVDHPTVKTASGAAHSTLAHSKPTTAAPKRLPTPTLQPQPHSSDVETASSEAPLNPKRTPLYSLTPGLSSSKKLADSAQAV